MATSQETRLKKAHVALLKHPETALYSGVILMGKSSVDDENFTAYTDGFNKRYSREFISKLSDEELRGIVMHENLHVALKHMQRFIREFKDNPHLTNVSADYVVNDIIMNFTDKNICKLPTGALYDKQFHNLHSNRPPLKVNILVDFLYLHRLQFGLIFSLIRHRDSL